MDAPEPAGLNHTFEIGRRPVAIVESCKGRLSVSFARRIPRPSDSYAGSSRSWRGFSYRESYSFAYDADSPDDITQWTAVAFPIWPLAGLVAIYPPVFLVRSTRLRRRRKRGQCLACGYPGYFIRIAGKAHREGLFAL